MPAYDYDATVSSIVQHRREAYGTSPPVEVHIRLEHLQKSVELFSNLSAHCPMTPLLWMQYAEDAAAVVSGLLAAEGGGGGSGGDNGNNGGEEAKAQAAETRLNILELAIDEFPGCALLRLRHLEAVVESSVDDDNASVASARKAFHDAISFVGRGSHRNEDGAVAAIYRLHVKYLLRLSASTASSTSSIAEEISASYLFRAECPMKEENDTLSDEIMSTKQVLKEVLSTAEDMRKIDDARIQASKTLGSFANLEDGVEVAMAEEYIKIPHNLVVGGDNDESAVNWNELLSGHAAIEGKERYLLGYGAASTSAAFAKYAGALSNRARKADNNLSQGMSGEKKDDEAKSEEEELKNEKDMFNSLAISVYERGLSECPTVESLWVSYLQCMFRLVDQDRQAAGCIPLGQSRHASLLKSACARSVRNCPYSARLFCMKMKSLAILAQVGATVFDPDEIMAVATEAVNDGFMASPEAQLEVHLNALRHVQRRIMALSCTSSPEEGGAQPRAYDASEPMDKSTKKKRRNRDSAILEITEYDDLDAEVEQDLRDLIDDSRDMYDATDAFLKKDHPSWTEGMAVLWSDRAVAESNIFLPLLRSMGGDGDEQGNGRKATDEAVRCFEKSCKAHQPPHPDLWMTYIRYVQGRHRYLGRDDVDADPPGANAAKFRKVRGLFARAMSLIKAKRDPAQSTLYFGARDYGSALTNLCHEYLEFERLFGSDESLNQASKTVKGKLRTLGESEGEGDPVAHITVQNGVHPPAAAVPAASSPADVADSSAPDEQRSVAMDIDTGEKSSKRRIDEVGDKDDAAVHPQKKPRVQDDNAQSSPAANTGTKKKANLKVEKTHPEHKVLIGDLEYPAHPFTVHVTNLTKDTEDMDLVDAFASRCGAIVHARIMREKHQGPRHVKAKSKGSGLIQFEERESVEKALGLDGEIGLHDKLVKVHRSHVPAVSIVPPGMHRVKPKGEGHSSKRNQKRKKTKKLSSAVGDGKEGKGGTSASASAPTSKPKTTSSLSFIPRGVGLKK